MTKTYKFFLEQSPTPIRQRIIENLQKPLIELGHKVILFNPIDFQNPQRYIDYINRHEVDYCIITNSRSILSSFSSDIDSFLFEKVNASLVFIHHDDPFSGCFSLNDVKLNLQAYLNTKNKSFHFFIEYSNFIDFKKLGINNSFTIFHSSEFKPIKKTLGLGEIDVAFVGHVLPGNDSYLEELPFSYLLKRDYWTRVSSVNEASENSSYLFARQNCGDSRNQLELFSLKFFYRAMLHKLSQSFRGEIITRISDNFNISIYGGDPSYLHDSEHGLILNQKNLKYYPATEDYSFSNQIYSSSKINLNITSLQFDTAVINRVIDIGFAGGFLLTDWKSDLHKITNVSEEISYRTIDELNSKIEYYLSHEKERQEIAFQLNEDISSKCSYSNQIAYIISQLNPMSLDPSDSIKVDLGCGSFKPSGFIGVDIGLQAGVDIVADLNRHFPFADSSVDVVRAHDTVEHLQDRLHTMNEIWRICKPGALVEILVPSTDGRGAFQDPTHVSYWNINSFKYYCTEFPSYLNLCKKYGFNGEFSLIALETIDSEDQVIHVLAKLIAVKDNELPDWIQEIDFRTKNIIIIVDWDQSEDILSEKIFGLLQSAISANNLASLGILFYLNGQITSENAQFILSGVIMDLYLQEFLADPECFYISFVSEIPDNQWESLLPSLSGQIMLDNVFLSRILDTIPIQTSIADVLLT